jgi:hypothetical protein
MFHSRLKLLLLQYIYIYIYIYNNSLYLIFCLLLYPYNNIGKQKFQHAYANAGI